MPAPSLDRDRVLESLSRFDREERDSPKWRGWEGKENHRYAIVHEGRLYPVKEIVSLATGEQVSSLSGGAHSNGIVQKAGFKIEALHLPTENEVQIALHELLLTRAPNPIEPTEAYEVLADQFALPAHLRTRRMENSDDLHWQNRVRFARRKLVDTDIIDPTERGRWKLALHTDPKVWVEKCLVKGRPDRLSGRDALGVALWSPTRARNGADIYRNMRLVQPNDVVLHFTDDTAFSGVSIAGGFADPHFVGVEGTSWAGVPSYRISLRDYVAAVPPLTRETLISNPESRQKLVAIRQEHSNLFYDPNLELHQGGYLTEAPPELVNLLDGAYAQLSGHSLPHLPVHGAKPQFSEPQPQPLEPGHRVWLYAPGPKAMYWEEFRRAGIAAIGWDDIGDLSALANREAIKARLAAR